MGKKDTKFKDAKAFDEGVKTPPPNACGINPNTMGSFAGRMGASEAHNVFLNRKSEREQQATALDSALDRQHILKRQHETHTEVLRMLEIDQARVEGEIKLLRFQIAQ